MLLLINLLLKCLSIKIRIINLSSIYFFWPNIINLWWILFLTMNLLFLFSAAQSKFLLSILIKLLSLRRHSVNKFIRSCSWPSCSHFTILWIFMTNHLWWSKTLEHLFFTFDFKLQVLKIIWFFKNSIKIRFVLICSGCV